MTVAPLTAKTSASSAPRREARAIEASAVFWLVMFCASALGTNLGDSSADAGGAPVAGCGPRAHHDRSPWQRRAMQAGKGSAHCDEPRAVPD